MTPDGDVAGTEWDPPATPRLGLRPIEERDVPDLVALDADPEVTRYVASTEPPDAEDFHRRILPRWNASFAESPFGFFAALDRGDDDAFLGWFHLRPDGPDPDVLDLGFRLPRRAWGKGLATEGGRALVAWGFSFPRITKITGHCLEANRASARVLEKCGMVLVDHFVADPQVLPGWDARRRRARAYAITRARFESDASFPSRA